MAAKTAVARNTRRTRFVAGAPSAASAMTAPTSEWVRFSKPAEVRRYLASRVTVKLRRPPDPPDAVPVIRLPLTVPVYVAPPAENFN